MINLPYRFGKIGESILITNEMGQYYFLEQEAFFLFQSHPDALPDSLKNDLISKFFLTEEQDLLFALDESAIKLRTKKAFLQDFTALHIIVLTYACNSQCRYCHASSSIEKPGENHMSFPTARKVCDCIMQSPSRILKIEFQGGEPTLNFPVLTFIVEYLEVLNKHYKKHLEYVVCTNLVQLRKDHLAFYKNHKIFISTSLDGPPTIHDKNRPTTSSVPNSQLVLKNIEKIHNEYGQDKVSALLTISKDTLPLLRPCVDAYLAAGLHSIFLRPLNPYGLAEKNLQEIGYCQQDYIEAYMDALEYILAINQSGTFIREEFACIFLQKILTPYSNGFVDIQSPPGTGIGCAVYDCDGSVYPSDEGRMLARCQDSSFRLGSVITDNYEDIFLSEKLLSMVQNNIIETTPTCLGCPFIPYCGIDPVRKYQDSKLQTPWDGCNTYKSMLTFLFEKIHNNPLDERVFFSWFSSFTYEELGI